ncbi:MAG TPA: FecR domain-containing protein [Thermoanaerobaculia bacterium]|jgi:ferric-dicitrate binding protein FerR (iron transport regulator)|nr:FecR domain-containing protein [Thermoanaerobaculia bacterium]
MSLFSKNDDLLDDAVAQVVNDPVDPREVEAAASRVWARLSQEGAQDAPASAPAGMTAMTAAAAAVPSHGLHGCEDFQSLIPAYLRGELSPARALLVEDHTRSCVPCRRALRDARDAREGRKVASSKPAPARPADRRVWQALAAVLLLALGFGVMTLIQDRLAGGARMARVEAVEGSLYRVAGDSSQPITAGANVAEGEEVRTAKGSTAMLRMADGSRIEMSERAGLALAAARKGNTIQLERGRIIVQAAKQRPRHLYVATRDALVSVTGTIFAVNSGTKGSRVSVVEGEVHVAQGSRDTVLHPGGQVATHASVQAVPVRDEVAWSRNAKQYQDLLAELTALGKDVDARVERPGLRYSTRLLDLAPEGTTIFVALPNLSHSLTQTQQILDQKIAESPSLAQWWAETLGSTQNESKFHDMIQHLGDLGQFLGDEVAIAMNAGDGDKGQAVLLAEVTNEASFRATLATEIARLNGEGKPGLRIVDDLSTATDGTGSHGLSLWIHNGLVVASPSVAQIQRVTALAAGGSNPFTASSFHQRIAEDYKDGAGWLFAADLGTLVAKGQAQQSAESRQRAEQLGILDLDHFIVDRREVDGRAETRAALTFSQARRGVAAWLAAPAPMGSLSFFSPDANMAAAFAVKSPVSILDELLSVNPKLAQHLADAQAKHGFDVRNDLLAPMGAEFAVGLDGPVLPSPSWKLVAEVYDPAHLQQTVEKAVAQCDAELRAHGKGGLQITHEAAGGRTYYTIQSAEPKAEIHYLFEDGYLLAGPSRALLERTLQQRDSGVTLATSPKLRNLLGPDGQVNVSALVYQNLAPLAQAAGKVLPDGSARSHTDGPARLGKLLAAQGPTLYYAYAETDRIVFAGSNQNPLGLNLGTLASMGSLAGMMNQAQNQASEEAR